MHHVATYKARHDPFVSIFFVSGGYARRRNLEPSQPTYRWNCLLKRTNAMLFKTVAYVGFDEKR